MHSDEHTCSCIKIVYRSLRAQQQQRQWIHVIHTKKKSVSSSIASAFHFKSILRETWCIVCLYASQTLRVRNFTWRSRKTQKKRKKKITYNRNVWRKQRHPPSFSYIYIFFLSHLSKTLFVLKCVWEVDVKLTVIVSVNPYLCVCVYLCLLIYMSLCVCVYTQRVPCRSKQSFASLSF